MTSKLATVLIVDSDESSLDQCKRALDESYDLLLCTDGEAALERARGREIAVAVIGHQPTQDALELFLRLTKTHPVAKRIVMANKVELDSIVGLVNRIQLGAFVLKPVNHRELLAATHREAMSFAEAKRSRSREQRIKAEHLDMLSILHDLDPAFEIPRSPAELKLAKERIRGRIAVELDTHSLQRPPPEDPVSGIPPLAEDENPQGYARLPETMPKVAHDDQGMAVVIDSGNQTRDQQIEQLARELSLTRAQSPAEAWRAQKVAIIKSEPVEHLEDRRVTVLRLWNKGRRDRTSNPLAGTAQHVIAASAEEYRDALGSTLSRLSSGGLLELADLLGPSAEIEEFEARHSYQRGACIDRFVQFAEGRGLTSRARSELCSSLDELFTNAVYNAPNEHGTYISANKSRTCSASSPRAVRIQFGSGDEMLGLAVRDHYGSLDPEAVLAHLRRCFETPQVSPLDKDGGAGIGLFLTMLYASRMVVNIDPGHTTEIVVLRNYRERYRNFSQGAPTFNMFLSTRVGDQAARRYLRCKVDWPSFISYQDGTRVANVRDISLMGAFIEVDLDGVPDIGAKVELTIAPANLSAPARVEGIVRWRGRSITHGCSGLGIEFLSARPHLVSLSGVAELSG